MSGTSTPAPRTGGRDGPVPPARRGSASAAIVLCVFALVVLTRWHPFLLGGPSVVLLATVAATLSPPRRRRRAARRARAARSGVPYSSVRQWDAARESLAQMPEAEISPDGGPPTLPVGRPDPSYSGSGYRAGPDEGGRVDYYDADRTRGDHDDAGWVPTAYGPTAYGPTDRHFTEHRPTEPGRADPRAPDPYGAEGHDPDPDRFEPDGEPLAVGQWGGDEGPGDPGFDERPEADEERPRRRGRRPWSATGDRPLVRVLDPSDAARGDPEQTMAIDMRPLLEENDLIEQTMAIDIRGYLHDPGYGRG